MATTPHLSKGCIQVLKTLVRTYEEGSSCFLVGKLFDRPGRFYDPTMRRCRILESHGYVKLVDETPTNRKYRTTPEGIARHDIEELSDY